MTRQIEYIRKTREYIIEQVRDLSLEKLNKIPHGLNNNILCNLGHLVAAQQSICYMKGGLPPAIPESAYASFKPGTRPERFFNNDEEDDVKELLISSITGLKNDYKKNAFANFTPWTNRYGNTLADINDAIAYLQFHEGLHIGVIMNMKKLVQK